MVGSVQDAGVITTLIGGFDRETEPFPGPGPPDIEQVKWGHDCVGNGFKIGDLFDIRGIHALVTAEFIEIGAVGFRCPDWLSRVAAGNRWPACAKAVNQRRLMTTE